MASIIGLLLDLFNLKTWIVGTESVLTRKGDCCPAKFSTSRSRLRCIWLW